MIQTLALVVSVLSASAALAVPSSALVRASDNFIAAKDQCAADQFSLDLGLGDAPHSGVIEILVPLPDTDGRDAKRYMVAPVVCIPLVEMANWEIAKGEPFDGLGDYDARFFVTYDPEGTLSASRSRFDYDILTCDELAETPKPPRDLLFGSFNWTKASGIKAQRVTWFPDLRAKLEMDCEREQ